MTEQGVWLFLGCVAFKKKKTPTIYRLGCAPNSKKAKRSSRKLVVIVVKGPSLQAVFLGASACATLAFRQAGFTLTPGSSVGCTVSTLVTHPASLPPAAQLPKLESLQFPNKASSNAGSSTPQGKSKGSRRREQSAQV